VSCPWLSSSLYGSYSILIVLGAPGAGKTTAALHIVAYDLLRRRAVKDYREALEEAGKRLYFGTTTEELVKYLLARARGGGGGGDWLIIDDAALGFLDVESTHAWAAIMDALKVARQSIAERGVILTTTARSFVAKRLVNTAKLIYVSRRRVGYSTVEAPAGGCRVVEGEEREYVVLKEIEWMVRSQDTLYPSEARLGIYSRLVGLIPIADRFAMPAPVEEAHMEARRRRVEAQLRRALTLLRRRKSAKLNKKLGAEDGHE
jgi:KaiC/GvpD/RAD55 family RecA-like ATPase